MAYEYRVVGVNVTPIPAPDPVKASEQLKVSKEFLEKEFASHYQNSQATNTPLQVQNLLNIYGKRGWQHDDVGKIGDQVRKSPLGPSPQKSRQTNPNKQQPNLCHGAGPVSHRRSCGSTCSCSSP